MTPTVAPSRALRVAVTRIHHRLGWGSLVGVALAVPALALAIAGWRDHQAATRTMTRMAATKVDAPDARAHVSTAPRPASAADKLPSMGEMPALLTQLEAIAIDNGLGWAAADYRLRPASDSEPASIEIRTQLTGPYPRLRRMASQALGRIPALAIRQLSFTRPNTEAADVEAKVVFAILLADGPAAGGSPAAHGGAP